MPIRSHLPEGMYPQVGPQRDLPDPLDAMSRALNEPPPVINEALRSGTRITGRWIHGELHDQLPPMSDHVVMTYYGASRDCYWREGGERQSSFKRPGQMTLIPIGHEGYWDINGPLEVSHIYLNSERLEQAAEGLSDGKPIELIQRIGFDDPTAAGIMRLLSNEAVENSGSSTLFVEQAIDLLCTHLIRGHSTLGALPANQRSRGLANWQVKKVAGYMQEHLANDIGIQELADLVGLSRFHFATAFRLATGQSPHAALTEIRMTLARQLLKQLDYPITRIALKVGYQTPSSFSAAFRKHSGLTPSEYRRLL